MDIKSKLVLAVVMTATVAGSAQAEGWRGRSHSHYDPPRHRPAQGRGADWIAPLLVLGIAGAAIGAAAQAPVRVVPPAMPVPVPVYAAPVYVTPSPAHVQPQAVALPYGLAYYCPSYGQYHPQVQSCPGGWQLVDVAR